MDLETYIARYSGETRLKRLLMVAKTTEDEDEGQQAYAMAEQQMKKDGNIKVYKEVFGSISSSAGVVSSQSAGAPPEEDIQMALAPESSTPAMRIPTIAYDAAWVSNQHADNSNDRRALQGRLSTAQSHLHKEATRSAYLAIAHHDRKAGDAQEALGSLLRATDYCTSRTQTAQISLSILEVCFGLEQYDHVREYVKKVEHTLSAVTGGLASPTYGGSGGAGGPSSPTGGASASVSLQEVNTKLQIASGLERLAQGDYDKAGSIFTSLITNTSNASSSTPSSGTTTSKLDWSGVACSEDVALYASLLCLATQSRASILELAEHPDALELVPAMKDLLQQWSRANYVKCMHTFSEGGQSALIPEGDLYLTGDRWIELSKKIREKCLLEYLRPYQRVKLDSMSKLFPTISDVEDTLFDLIGRGLLPNAKIDARANILFEVPPKPSVDLVPMERKVLDDTHAMLVRLACLEHDLSVQDASARGRKSAAASSHYDDGFDDSDEDRNDDGDTPMINADDAMNPEDLY